jgi:hypothetical protein
MCKESLINSNSVHWSWPEDGTARQNFERGSPKDFLSKAWIHGWLSSLRGKQLKFRPPFLFLATVAMFGWMSGLPDTILKGGHQRTKQSLVPIGPVVSEMKIFWISSPFFIFSNSNHVGWRSGLSDTILEGDHQRTIPPKFGLKWPSGFRGEYS